MHWIKKNWKFLAVLVASVLVLSAVIVMLRPQGQFGANQRPQDGPETGVYYYDTAEGEYLLTLNSGNVFTIAGPMIFPRFLSLPFSMPTKRASYVPRPR